MKKVTNLSRHKPTITLLSAIFLIMVGCGLLIAGFVVPPPGEIHNSVLIAFGEICTFSGALFGIKYRYQYGSKAAEINNSSNPQTDTTDENH